MAEMMGAASISKALISFVRLIDYNYESSDAMVSIRKEIECIEEYIYLQKLRYQNKFTSKIEIDEDILDFGILKLILQPIIENSIVHGLEKKKGVGLLSVRGYKSEDDNIIFQISDSGLGMSKNTVDEILKIKLNPYKRKGINGIGLANVQMRMHFHYGEEYRMRIQSSEGLGTTVTLKFPIIKIEASAGEFYENINS
jgi:two-component system, sensor histidine kinase YesM